MTQPPSNRPVVPYAVALFTVLDATVAPVVGVTADGTIDYLNPAAVLAFGYAPDELVGRPVEILTGLSADHHAQLRDEYAADVAPRFMGSGLELSARRKDGSTFPVEISLTPVPTEDGPWVLAEIVDISGRRAARERAHELSRARLALTEFNVAILRAHTPEELFETACAVLSDAGDGAGVWVGLPVADGGLEVVARAGDVGPLSAAGGELVSELPALARVLDVAAPWFCRDIGAETSGRWREWALSSEITGVLSLPLSCGGLPVATFTINTTRISLLDEEFVAVLVTMAENLSLALDRFDAQDRMRTIDAQRVVLLGRLVAAQEKERARIAADVHDHSVQALAALDLRLGMHRNQLRLVAPELLASTDVLHSGLAEVTAGLRLLLFDLEPVDVDATLLDLLQDALDHVFEDIEIEQALEVVADDRGASTLVDLSPDLRGQALRIFKEALANVRQHGHAGSVRVTVTPDDDGVEVAVIDDGIGPLADVATLRSAPGHRGLDGMRDRAEVAGGWCRLERDDDLTVLRFWLPRDAVDTASP